METNGFLIDRDGVLLHAKDGAAIPGAIQWMQKLIRQRIPYLIATNHTTSSPEDAALELQVAGFSIHPEKMHTPITILFEYFQRQPPGRIWARGTPKFLAFLASNGYQLTREPDADVVLLGFDQTMDYQAVSDAIEAIVNHDASFIALHENRLYKNADGKMEPGLGAWVRAIEYATGIAATIIGKPSPEYYRRALERLGISAESAVMISDDPLGDLAGAKSVGIRTVFVTSGKYPQRILEQLPSELQPDIILGSIAELEIG